MKPSPFAARPRRSAFTLAETLVAVALVGLTSIGVISFMRQALKMYYADRARVLINQDVRKFTAQMDSDAVTSNFFCIYPSFGATSVTVGGVTSDAAVADGQVGDYLVLLFTDPATTGTTGTSMITRVVGYYREVTNTTLNTGPVHRFDLTLATPVAANSAPMYTILSNLVTGSISSYPTLTQLAQGLTTNATGTTTTPALFYNLQNRSIMISTQIVESLTQTGTTTQTGNTYNFTVSPRG